MEVPEQEFRRLKTLNWWLLVGVGTLFGLYGLTLAVVVSIWANSGSRKEEVGDFDAVVAREYVVIDEGGKIRARLGIMKKGAPGLLIADENEVTRVELGIPPGGGPWLVLRDANHVIRFAAALQDTGFPMIARLDQRGKMLWGEPPE